MYPASMHELGTCPLVSNVLATKETKETNVTLKTCNLAGKIRYIHKPCQQPKRARDKCPRRSSKNVVAVGSNRAFLGRPEELQFGSGISIDCGEVIF